MIGKGCMRMWTGSGECGEGKHGEGEYRGGSRGQEGEHGERECEDGNGGVRIGVVTHYSTW